MAPEERREHLLDCALRVLGREGFYNVSIEAIAKEAGVSRPVVYDAYGGLEPLLNALLDRTQKRALRQVLTVLKDIGAPEDVDAWLVDGTTRVIVMMQQDPDVWRPILGLVRGAPREVRDRIEETRNVIRRYLAAAIEAGLQLRGTVGLDADLLSHIAMATLEEFGRLVLELPPLYENERIIAGLQSLLAAFGSPKA
jgi:AcrR family transcriptional regulator